jgi:hypothetical protein
MWIINMEFQEAHKYCFPTTHIASPGSTSISPVAYLHLYVKSCMTTVHVVFAGYQLLRGSCPSHADLQTIFHMKSDSQLRLCPQLISYT